MRGWCWRESGCKKHHRHRMTRKRQLRIKVRTILPRGISLLAILPRSNMAGKLFLFLGFAAAARGAVVPTIPVATAAAVAPLAKLEEFDAVPQYSFAYDVQDAVTGDSKAQYETRNGDIVQGSYSLIEADGTRRIVEYTADPINGFNAIVSREPATAAVAAVATPVLPFRPAALTPVAAPITPVAGPAPSIPAVGPDSDVEVVEARTGPLRAKPTTREQEIQRQQLQQLQRLQDQQRQQQQEQHLQQLQQLQDQQRQSSRLQIQQQQQRQLLLQQRQQQSQVQLEEQRQQEQQQQEQQQAVAPARTIIAGQTPQIDRRPIANRLINLPATATAARAIATYPTYPYITYNAAYSSPFAYAAPLTYAPSAATAAALA